MQALVENLEDVLEPALDTGGHRLHRQRVAVAVDDEPGEHVRLAVDGAADGLARPDASRGTRARAGCARPRKFFESSSRRRASRRTAMSEWGSCSPCR